MTSKLGFLGAGQMASALAHGAVNGKLFAASDLMFCDPAKGQLQKMSSSFAGFARQLQTQASCSRSAVQSSWRKAAVLPQIADQIALVLSSGHTLISIAAGIS